MPAHTHRAMIVLDLYAVDDQHAREIVDTASGFIIPLAGVFALEASPPVRARHQPGSLPTNPDEQGTWLDAADAAAAGQTILAYIELRDRLTETLGVRELPHRGELEEIAARLGVEPAPAGADVVQIRSAQA